jgi:hypothetical protein
MARDPDDDALRWEGDDDPTLAPGWKAVGTSVPLEGSTEDAETDAPARDAGTHGTDVDTVDEADAAAQPGSAELVILGVLGGVYLLYAVGWLITAIGPAPDLADPVAQFMYALGRWFAVAASALWFGAVLWLTAEHRRARLLWLIAGAVLLVPIPFVLRG